MGACRPFSKCVCSGDLMRLNDDATGPCVTEDQCPPSCCNENEHYVVDSYACEKTCANRKIYHLMGPCMPVSRCMCNGDLMRLNNVATGPCVTEDQCPPVLPTCGLNEIAVQEKYECPPQTCDSILALYNCENQPPPKPGCICIDGYLRNSTGDCIPSDQCPNLGGDDSCPDGDRNATRQECASWCQPTCSRPVPGEICPAACLPRGCVCKEGYILAADGKCIAVEDCPPGCNGDANATVTTCTTGCPATCTPNDRVCPAVCGPIGCACLPGYVLSDEGKCILKEDCPDVPNACTSDCAPTCANPNPNCFETPRCCEPGLIQLHKGSKCTKIEDCPKKGCNGDPNAVIKSCPAPCPSSCSRPNSIPCRKACIEVGCECAPGYIYSEDAGKCVKPDACPGGNPCGPNGMFVGCKNSCPTDYCPVDDSRVTPICETYPFAPCNSGCVCNYGYIKNNRQEDKCILPNKCPPVKCTRPNERWDSCPSACLAEGCQDVNNQPTTCNTLVANVCRPRCVCNKGYFRNSTDICVPACNCDI